MTRAAAPLWLAVLPYAAVAVGLHLWHSALLAVGLYHGVLVCALLAHPHRPPLRSLSTGWNAASALPLIVAVALIAPLTPLLWPIAVPTGLALEDALAALGLAELAVPFAAYSLIANPALEELFWRGLLADPRPGPAPVDLLFAGYHALVLMLFLPGLWVLLAVTALAAASWIWRRTAASSGGLAIPWLTHLAADLAVVIGVALTVGF